MNEPLANELIAMAGEDLKLRAELAADGSLFEGYHPRMRALHERNADRLTAILAEVGWPGADLVGGDASEAAWLVVQHAISRPKLMRTALSLLRKIGPEDSAAGWQLAMLEDRILVFEGRKQHFGTQFDWDEAGAMSPLPIEDPGTVDTRRAEMGLPPLAVAIADHRSRMGGESKPADFKARRAEAEAFAREVGWR